MRVLIAPQEFKRVLSARDVAEAIASGVRSARPGWKLDLAPIADGGPGTLEVVLTGQRGAEHHATVGDPLGRPVSARWVLLNDGTAVVEMAQASGLWRLAPEERDARRASTFGTGQLIAEAAKAGAKRIVVGAGGSATNDGGAGALEALGAKLNASQDGLTARGARHSRGESNEAAYFRGESSERTGSDNEPVGHFRGESNEREGDARGERELVRGGGSLSAIARIDLTRVRVPPLTVLTDVRNPLLGTTGATRIFGPQKGADASAIEELERGLHHFADVLERTTARHVRDTPGAGAAGGLAFGLACGLGADIRPGFDTLAELIGLGERIQSSDVVITGEGRLDAQTGFGKGPGRIAERARAAGKRVLCICGVAEPGARLAFDEVIEVSPSAPPSSREEAVRLVASAAEQWAASRRP